MIQTTGPSVTVEAIAAKRAELREIGLRAYIEAVEREAAIRLAMIDAERDEARKALVNAVYETIRRKPRAEERERSR